MSKKNSSSPRINWTKIIVVAIHNLSVITAVTIRALSAITMVTIATHGG